MRYLFMDNQLNTQEPISKQTPVIPDPIVPKTPVLPVAEESEEVAPPVAPESTVPSEYEEILNQYAASQQTQAPVQEVPVEETPILETQSPETTPSPVEPVITEPETTEPTLTDFGITPKPPQNNIFKIFFIVALIIFVLVATALVFVYFKSQQTAKSVTTTKAAVTSVPSGTCSLNDKTYNVGESFAAADGCNTCTCGAQNIINCTENKCLASQPATGSAVTATPVSTASASTTSAVKK